MQLELVERARSGDHDAFSVLVRASGFPFGLVVTDDGIYARDAGGLPDFGFTSLIRKFEPITFP